MAEFQAAEVTASSFQMMDDVPFPGQDASRSRGQDFSRTPPTNTPSSYGRHIQKRGRVSTSATSAGSWGRFGGGGTGGAAAADGHGSRSRSTDKMSTSLSGRLRSVSDLERAGFVSSSEKGTLKDLIITGDETLRQALDKYQAGDPSELEQLISRGHLDRNGSFDLTELDNLDLGSLGLEGMDFLGIIENGQDATAQPEQDFDYDFAATGGGFEMDDILNLPFPGMDDLPGHDDPTRNGGAHAHHPALHYPRADAHHHVPGGPGQAVTPMSVSSGPGGPSGLHSMLASASGGAKADPHHAHQVPQAPQMGLGSGGGGGSSSGGGGGSSGTSKRGGSSQSGSAVTTGPGGVTAFPNSSNSGSRFPVSNCVSEMPVMGSLPQGAAPAYEQLINFQRAKSKDAIRCVMCGQAPNDGDGGTVIPQQNKDVCRNCDKALWVHGETRTFFKWCKGCKRFRNIVAFSEKLDASKCNGCRERGRRSYLQRKGMGGAQAPAPATSGATGDDLMATGL